MIGSEENKKHIYVRIVKSALVMVLILGLIISLLEYRDIKADNNVLKTEMEGLRAELYEAESYTKYLEDKSKNNTEYKDLDSNYADLKKINKSNTNLLDEIYSVDENSAENHNPIDKFFEEALMSDYTNSKMIANAALREKAWKEEMDAAYTKIISLVDDTHVADFEKSQKDITEYVESSEKIHIAFSRGAMGTVDAHNFGKEIYKDRTLKLHDSIEKLGEDVNYNFSEKDYREQGGNLYLSDSYFTEYYSIVEKDNKFVVTLYDERKSPIVERESAVRPAVENCNYGVIKFSVKTSEKLNDIYEYKTYSGEINNYKNVLYTKDEVKVYVENDKIIFSDGYGINENQIERAWKRGDIESSIVDVKVYTDSNYAHTLRLSYFKEGEESEIVEFIEFS